MTCKVCFTRTFVTLWMLIYSIIIWRSAEIKSPSDCWCTSTHLVLNKGLSGNLEGESSNLFEHLGLCSSLWINTIYHWNLNYHRFLGLLTEWIKDMLYSYLEVNMPLWTVPSAVDIVRGGNWSWPKYLSCRIVIRFWVLLSQIARLRKSWAHQTYASHTVYLTLQFTCHLYTCIYKILEIQLNHSTRQSHHYLFIILKT